MALRDEAADKHRSYNAEGGASGPQSSYVIPFSATYSQLPRRVLKQGDTFAVFNPFGDFVAAQRPDEGLYHSGTRFLSHFQLRIANTPPVLLSSNVRRDSTLFTVDLTNADSPDGAGGRPLAKDRVHLARTKFLWNGTCYERIKIRNYGPETVNLLMQFTFDADFADIFEVRGQKRPKRGRREPTKVAEDRVTLRYRGRDKVLRKTEVAFHPAPYEISPSSARHLVSLGPSEATTIYVTISCEGVPAAPLPWHFMSCLRASRRAMAKKRENAALIYTSNELFNEWINRSLADLYTLVSDTEHGPYPYAGIPWFSTPFGRDGIVTALLSLWKDPSLARGVLSYLAATQATECNSAQESQPGKIVHELRNGEMAALGEIPFARYYGSADATPLFVILAGRYFERTGDLDFIRSLWPNIESALNWIDTYGDLDGDGFVEYERGTANGLRNQGWKDSDDSVFHRDGALAEGPIALCEVQSYVYEAKQFAASMATALGNVVTAETLATQASLLRERFRSAFWCEEMSTYALALDGEKRPCCVRTSNPGHALYNGIVDSPHAGDVMKDLMSADLYSGWGVRTVATTERLFNPMSYHNGSVWPHDNALIALGLARYGFKAEVVRLMTGMFEASTFMELHRLPELFCGFARATVENPILYPVACVPQAWSSATALGLLDACLGLSFDVKNSQIHVRRPMLPKFLDEVHVRNLTVGESTVDLLFRRHDHDVSVVSTDRQGHVEIIVTS